MIPILTETYFILYFAINAKGRYYYPKIVKRNVKSN